MAFLDEVAFLLPPLQTRSNEMFTFLVYYIVQVFEDLCEYKLYLHKEKFNKYKLHN